MAEVNLGKFGYVQSETVSSATKTLNEGDNGVVQNVTVDCTVTLPSTVVGTSYILRVGADNVTLNISPAAVDKIMGNGFTSADNKDAIFTDQPIGSYVRLVGDGVNGWMVAEVHGTMTQQA